MVIDLAGKKDGGTIVGDNLFYYVMTTTKTGGLVVDGGIRDLEGIANMDMAAYFRHAHPSAIANMMLTGINVPIRIGNVTVMPGDLVVGDREGIYFIPPQFVKEICDKADETHIHDEWTRKKFDEHKYKSSDIYGSPKDPELKKEYQEYLKRAPGGDPQVVISRPAVRGRFRLRAAPVPRLTTAASGFVPGGGRCGP